MGESPDTIGPFRAVRHLAVAFPGEAASVSAASPAIEKRPDPDRSYPF